MWFWSLPISSTKSPRVTTASSSLSGVTSGARSSASAASTFHKQRRPHRGSRSCARGGFTTENSQAGAGAIRGRRTGRGSCLHPPRAAIRITGISRQLPPPGQAAPAPAATGASPGGAFASSSAQPNPGAGAGRSGGRAAPMPGSPGAAPSPVKAPGRRGGGRARPALPFTPGPARPAEEGRSAALRARGTSCPGAGRLPPLLLAPSAARPGAAPHSPSLLHPPPAAARRPHTRQRVTWGARSADSAAALVTRQGRGGTRGGVTQRRGDWQVRPGRSRDRKFETRPQRDWCAHSFAPPHPTAGARPGYRRGHGH